MTQEEKNLLLKDLCARQPYGVKIEHTSGLICTLNNLTTYRLYDGDNIKDIYGAIDIFGDGNCVRVEYFRPYLFPLSSMTEEQWNNAPRVNLTNFTFESLVCGCFTLASYTCENNLHDLVEFINWLIENHFDIYGLITKGLAIDATGLNIY